MSFFIPGRVGNIKTSHKPSTLSELQNLFGLGSSGYQHGLFTAVEELAGLPN